jgi:hypothetical protein
MRRGMDKKLAKQGKAVKDEYEDRLAVEGTLKEQQTKAMEMQELTEEDDKGKKSKKKKKSDDDDSDSDDSSYEPLSCCVIL